MEKRQAKKVLYIILGALILLVALRAHVLGPILKIASRFALPIVLISFAYFWTKKRWPSLFYREGQPKKHVEKEGDRVIEICPKCGEMLSASRHKCSNL